VSMPREKALDLRNVDPGKTAFDRRAIRAPMAEQNRGQAGIRKVRPQQDRVVPPANEETGGAEVFHVHRGNERLLWFFSRTAGRMFEVERRPWVVRRGAHDLAMAAEGD